MIQFNKISIDAVYLTSNDLVSGDVYIANVTGLTPLLVATSRIVRRAADGMPKAQFRTNAGKRIEVFIPLIQQAKFDALITAINATEAAGNKHHVTFDGMRGTFDLTLVLEDLDDSGDAIEAGIQGFRLVFAVHTVNSIS